VHWLSSLIERIEEFIERLQARPTILGEGKALDILMQRLDNRRPQLVPKIIKAIEEWRPGERIFGEKRRKR